MSSSSEIRTKKFYNSSSVIVVSVCLTRFYVALLFLFSSRYVYLEVLKKLGWSKVASLSDKQQYSEYISHLQDFLQTNSINFIMNRKFEGSSQDMSMVSQNAHQHQTHLITQCQTAFVYTLDIPTARIKQPSEWSMYILHNAIENFEDRVSVMGSMTSCYVMGIILRPSTPKYI